MTYFKEVCCVHMLQALIHAFIFAYHKIYSVSLSFLKNVTMKQKIFRPSLFFFHVADSIRAPLRTDQSEYIHYVL